MTPAIQCVELSKRYEIGHPRSGSLRETMMQGIHRIFSGNKIDTTSFWALKDVSFEVHQGEVLGIIGRNGAGKSTLLKILSRITAPTTGRIEMEGRVGSLLEAGTGFHPELTGRENIFMNGAILGMKRAEIRKKFDEIVDFAGIEKFLDTPVKRYSSGMYVKLAFAVAAHLEPEILIVDEVLAVGDAAFQKKCIGKMKDVSSHDGRTILFVSHNMNAVRALCNRGLVLQDGIVKYEGSASNSIKKYVDITEIPITESETGIFYIQDKLKKNQPGIQWIKTFCNGDLTTRMFPACECYFEIGIKNYSFSNNIVLGFVIKDSFERPYFAINNHHLNIDLNTNGMKDFIVGFSIRNFPFYGDKRLMIDLYFGDGISDHEILKDAFYLDIDQRYYYGGSTIPDSSLNKVVIPDITAHIAPLNQKVL